ncbi:MAG TPA: hypothetical protein DD658_07770 [Deltaproteobacteria bacterium]|nr:hypothetical protein [Deltaproteobacteria bacterium]
MMAVALALFAVPGHAAEESAEVAGVPAYSVTRLKIFEGSAWVRTPDSGDWEEFSSNSPVPVGSLVSIPEGSEAELQFHGGQFVLLTSGTELSIRGSESGKTAFALRSGEIRFFLPETDFAPVSVSAPGGGRANFSVPGRYWMTSPKGGNTTLVVREGEGIITVEGGEFPVKAGEQASMGEDVRVGKYEGGDRDSVEKPPPLSDAEEQAGVPPAAANELRDYGEWVNSSEYGYVWRPRVSPGWSPYYYGRWAWISPYGWTWVSYEPWGWYPYHYGYWYTDPVFGWVWYPYRSFLSFSFAWGGAYYPYYHGYAYYYPARVRFVRNGRNVRWVPLRPGERTGRIAYTRSDTRLAAWERPLSRGTVYVRGRGNQSGDWRDWTAVRRERNVSVSTRGTPRRNEARPIVQNGDRGSPGPGGGGAERSTRTQSDRSRNLRETERPARESPARQERLERIPPSSPRPGRRSGVRTERSNALTRTEKYENSVRSRVLPSSAVIPSGAGQRSSPGRGEGGVIPRGGRAPAAPAPGREIRPQAEPGPREQAERSPRVRSSSSRESRPQAEPGPSGGRMRR